MTVLFFDLMDTVVYDPYREAFAASVKGSSRRAIELRDRQAWPRFELGELTEEEFSDAFFPASVRSMEDAPQFDLASFNRVRRAEYRWMDAMEPLLQELASAAKQGALRCHIASNYPVWIEEVREKFQLDRYFHGVHASYELKARKPDEAFFSRLLSRVGATAEQCWLIDDREDNCRAAERVGFRSHLFRSAQQLREQLSTEGLL